MSNRSRRGTTLVELLITMILTVIVMTTGVTLYSFVAIRSGEAVSQYNNLQISNELLDAMDEAITDASSCQLVTLNDVPALKCSLPDTGKDPDGDGILDSYDITKVNKLMGDVHSPGKRVWLYSSEAPGNPTAKGYYWFRAYRNDDVTITSADIDNRWSYRTAGNPRRYYPGVVTLSINQADKSVTVTMTPDSSIDQERQTAGFVGTKTRAWTGSTLSRTFFWRGNQ